MMQSGKNIGALWLEFCGLSASPDIDKLTALILLEMSVDWTLGSDAYPHLYVGNVEGTQASIAILRRMAVRWANPMCLAASNIVAPDSVKRFLETLGPEHKALYKEK